MRIVIIGSGNIATFFAMKFHQAGFEIVQVISAHADHAKILAANFHCAYSSELSDLKYDADIYLLAVKDDVLLEFARNLLLQHKTIIHTAGSVNLEELHKISGQVACIWPVYSISKDHLPHDEHIPLVVNANDAAVLERVDYVAKAISDQIFHLNDEQKSALHLAAVFANNFTNHLYAVSKEIVEAKNIPFETLHPIILNTAHKLLSGSPEQNQTGPAIRHDERTMQKHRDLLSDNDLLMEIYKLMSKSIQESV